MFRANNFIIKRITRSLIIFKKARKMTNDFFNHYMFVRTFQWTSSECLTNVTITVKVPMVTYIYCENGSLNLTSEAYLLTYKHLKRSFSREQFTAEPVNWFHKKTPSQKSVDSIYTSILHQLKNFNGTDCSWTFRVGPSCLMCSASASFLLNSLFL